MQHFCEPGHTRVFEKKAPNFLDFVMTLVNFEPDCSLKKYQRFYTTKTSYNTY